MEHHRFLDSTYTVTGLTPGTTYEVRLYFLDWYWSKVGQRVFDVSIDAVAVLTDFDIIKAAVDAGGDGSRLGVERDVPRSLLTTRYNAFERIVLAADDVSSEPRERLRRLANAFVQWGLANPGFTSCCSRAPTSSRSSACSSAPPRSSSSASGRSCTTSPDRREATMPRPPSRC